MTDTDGEAEQGTTESEQSGTEPEQSDTGPEQGTTESDDPKERFRAALEAKREAQHRSETGRQNTGSVHGGDVPGGGHRVFRRRAGG
jgi:hypothetical protein